MKKQHSKSTATLPVSQKFYDGIMQRITSVASLLSDPERSAQVMKQTIDAYMLRGCEPGMASGLDVMIVFRLLRPEIDKALERSRRARQRAIKRRDRDDSRGADDAPKSLGLKDSLLVEIKRRGLPGIGSIDDLKKFISKTLAIQWNGNFQAPNCKWAMAMPVEEIENRRSRQGLHYLV